MNFLHVGPQNALTRTSCGYFILGGQNSSSLFELKGRPDSNNAGFVEISSLSSMLTCCASWRNWHPLLIEFYLWIWGSFFSNLDSCSLSRFYLFCNVLSFFTCILCCVSWLSFPTFCCVAFFYQVFWFLMCRGFAASALLAAAHLASLWSEVPLRSALMVGDYPENRGDIIQL